MRTQEGHEHRRCDRLAKVLPVCNLEARHLAPALEWGLGESFRQSFIPHANSTCRGGRAVKGCKGYDGARSVFGSDPSFSDTDLVDNLKRTSKVAGLINLERVNVVVDIMLGHGPGTSEADQAAGSNSQVLPS